MRIIKEVNYSPHLSARSLISGKTYSIGLLVQFDLQQFPTDFLPSVLAGMTTKLNECGYNLNIFFDQIKGKKNQTPLELFTKNRLDGLIILSVETESELAFRVAKIDLPIVLVNQRIEGMNLNSVVADDEGGAYQATLHLLELGHRRIVYINGDPRFKTSVDRKAGYCRALLEKGINPDPNLEKVGYSDSRGGYAVMTELLNERSDFTAVFAANDLMALGAITAIKKRGLKAPEDIAVAGFDDADFAQAIDPTLTTVKKPRALMGSEAARIMMEMINHRDHDEAEQLVLPTRLVVRQSSGIKIR